MAEQEIKYIPYGQDEISQQDLMTSLANGIDSYLGNKRWARKDKYRNAWLAAYQDIINRGLLGASNESGVWKINHEGEEIPMNEKSNIEREMYGDAAYYIRQQMSRITPRKKEEEDKKKNLDKFDFYNTFHEKFMEPYFGKDELFSDPEQGWNALDKRQDNGLRLTANRRLAMQKVLREYLKDLDSKEYNFEESGFKDKEDVRTKIEAAIKALDTDSEEDDFPAFNALGLKYRSYFSNGGNDASGYTNKETGESLTWNQYNKYQQEQAKLKTQQEAEKVKAAQKAAYDNTLFITRGSSKLQGQNPQTLKAKYGASDKLIQALYNYSQQDIRKLTPDEQSEIHGAYRYLAKEPIDGKLLKQLQSSSGGRYVGTSPNRFKKINGIDNLIWDSAAGQVIQIQTRNQYNTNKNQPQDLFKEVKTQEELNKEEDKAQQQYLNNTEWTADQTRELMGIAADVASVVDPEPFTAGGLALTGTGLRTYNRATDADGFTWSDAGHTALDTGLSLLGMIPVVGDAALAARVVGKLQKAAGWLGAAFAATSVPQAAKAAWNKVVNGQDMTVDDWRAIGNVLMGATQARRIQLNRAAGNAIKNQGGTTAKEKVGEVEVKVNGKTEKVEIDEASAKELQQAYKAAGSDQKATTEALRKSRKVREQLEAKKTSDGKSAYTKEQLDAMEAPQAASGSVRGRIPGVHDTRGIKITERSVQTSGTPVSELNLGTLAQMRINAVQNNTGWFNRGDFGWNMRGGNSEQQSSGWLSRMWQNLKNPYKPKTQKQQEAPKQETTQQETQQPQQQTTREQQFDRATINRYKETVLNRNNKPTDQRFSKRNITDGEYNIGGEQVTIKKEADGTFSLTSNSGKYELRKKSQNEIKEMVASIVKSQRKSVDQQSKVTKKSIKEIGKILQDLKRKGWLKQGGTINNNLDTTIENFFKNNNNI